MGFNTEVLIFNDHLHDMENCENLGRKLASKISAMSISRERSREIYIPGVEVVDTHHADTVNIIASGGNCSLILGRYYDINDTIGMLKHLASEHGYRLVKKSKKP
jgi:hypothetical protein